MGTIATRVMCRECKRLEKVLSEGEMFGVEYVIKRFDKKYIIVDNKSISWDEIMPHIREFNITYVPKFGKYEIEQFVGHMMLEALLITKDITNLMNMDLLCEEYPYNAIKIDSDILKERVLKCFDIVKTERNSIYLKFKWEKVS